MGKQMTDEEKQKFIEALKQAKNAVLSVIHTTLPHSPARKECEKALRMIEECISSETK